MPFRPEKKGPNFDALLSTLNSSRIQNQNPALYQTISELIKASAQSEKIFTSAIKTIQESSGSGGSVVDLNSDYLTWSDESVDLVNSRRLLPGTNITFDDSIINQRTINVASLIDYVIMTTGAEPGQILTDGAGNGIYTPYVP